MTEPVMQWKFSDKLMRRYSEIYIFSVNRKLWMYCWGRIHGIKFTGHIALINIKETKC